MERQKVQDEGRSQPGPRPRPVEPGQVHPQQEAGARADREGSGEVDGAGDVEGPMSDQVHLDALVARHRRGERLKMLFFWGHTPKVAGVVDKSCFSQWYPA